MIKKQPTISFKPLCFKQSTNNFIKIKMETKKLQARVNVFDSADKAAEA